MKTHTMLRRMLTNMTTDTTFNNYWDPEDSGDIEPLISLIPLIEEDFLKNQ